MSTEFPGQAEPARDAAVTPSRHNGIPASWHAGVLRFSQPDLMDCLGHATDAEPESLPFGLIGMALDGHVELYNETESRLSGLSPSRVIGRHLFTQVAPCTNNYMIGHRFETEAELDATIDYVFTLRMAPTPVRLRLLKRPDVRRMYLAVERR